jgi:hypothetical protein
MEANKVLARKSVGTYLKSANRGMWVLAGNESWSRKKSANNLLKLVSIELVDYIFTTRVEFNSLGGQNIGLVNLSVYR